MAYNVFESFVNSERCKTSIFINHISTVFESFVNSERCKTRKITSTDKGLFESFVNSERCKTLHVQSCVLQRLRALLIRKDVKLSFFPLDYLKVFESFVNSERCKTIRIVKRNCCAV